MNALQKQINDIEKKNGTLAYAYSIDKLGFDAHQTLEELYRSDVQ